MSRFVLPFQTVFDKNGHPLSGAKLYFYENDTVTLKDTYADSDFTTPNKNPVVADNQGEFGNIHLKGEYRVDLKNKKGVSQPNYPANGVPGVFGQLYTTVASLKLTTLAAGQTVQTQGYYAAGDGGGGDYLIVSPQSFDGYADHELANGNIAVLQYLGNPHVKQFGAKGDGAFDDSVIFQAANDSVVAGGGGVVDFSAPPINWLFESTVKIGASVIFEGDGSDSEIKGNSATPHYTVFDINGSFSGVRNCRVTASNDVSTDHGLTRIRIQNVDGVSVDVGDGPNNVLIENVRVDKSSYNGVQMFGCTDVLIKNFSVTNSKGHGISSVNGTRIVIKDFYAKNQNEKNLTFV